MSKTINARVKQLHNTQEIWERDYLSFIPAAGELVVTINGISKVFVPKSE